VSSIARHRFFDASPDGRRIRVWYSSCLEKIKYKKKIKIEYMFRFNWHEKNSNKWYTENHEYIEDVFIHIYIDIYEKLGCGAIQYFHIENFAQNVAHKYNFQKIDKTINVNSKEIDRFFKKHFFI
jgi:hypothetical protein